MDQAQSLKKWAQAKRQAGSKLFPTEIIAITSGKGGVGKTQISLNLALALARDSKVLLLDADMGTANVDVLLGIDPRRNLSHVLHQNAKISEILVPVTENLDLLPGTSGLSFQAGTQFGWSPVIEEADQLSACYEYIIVDTAAGISENIVNILGQADRVLLICTTEPTSIVDAYALCKTLYQKNPHRNIDLVANSVENEEQALEIFTKIQGALRHFLKKDISYLSYILYDSHIIQSIHQQKPVFLSFPNAPASGLFGELASRLKHDESWQGGKGLGQLFRTLRS